MSSGLKEAKKTKSAKRSHMHDIKNLLVSLELVTEAG